MKSQVQYKVKECKYLSWIQDVWYCDIAHQQFGSIFQGNRTSEITETRLLRMSLYKKFKFPVVIHYRKVTTLMKRKGLFSFSDLKLKRNLSFQNN